MNVLSIPASVSENLSETRNPSMYSSMARLLDLLSREPTDSQVINWASPVPFFGDLSTSRIATVGINPSNLEFVDGAGTELTSSSRRLATLRSLQLASWEGADGRHVRTIVSECEQYFGGNPYRRWFDVLERVLSISGHSYYPSVAPRACHLDLVPFATSVKWGLLSNGHRRALMEQGRQTVAEFVRDSSLEYLILNGRSVVSEFESFASTQLDVQPHSAWSLPRRNGGSVGGLLFRGQITRIGRVDLERPVRVIGYNHNLQSSFGVTSSAMRAIGEFLGDQIACASTY